MHNKDKPVLKGEVLSLSDNDGSPMTEVEMRQRLLLAEQQKRQVFVAEYKALCNKYGLQFGARPIFVDASKGGWQISAEMVIVAK